jgi:crotonobetainyl-CoA:carnitine CoA-transferase CaiB-like acyl-CoA transferase
MAPDLGRDTRQVLADILGLDNAAIDRLQDHGAVHARETADAG